MNLRNIKISLDDLTSEDSKLLFLELMQEKTAGKIEAVKQIKELKEKLGD